jgi:AP endonuclease-1
MFMMSRRSSKKTDNQIPEIAPANTVATPKKGRKVVKIDETEVVAKSPAKSMKKKVEAEAEYVENNTEQTKVPSTIKINKVKAKALLEGNKAPKPKKAAAKRKAKAEDDEHEDGDEDAGKKKATKKRKTKEEKEAENMPLAARTSIGALKKAMHIGAHVSGAGGTFS